MGNPDGPCREMVILTNVTQAQILDAERMHDTPEKLAIPLLLLLLTATELSHGNYTKPVRGDIKQLDSERLWAIKCKKMFSNVRKCSLEKHLTYTYTFFIDYMFPIDGGCVGGALLRTWEKAALLLTAAGWPMFTFAGLPPLPVTVGPRTISDQKHHVTDHAVVYCQNGR